MLTEKTFHYTPLPSFSEERSIRAEDYTNYIEQSPIPNLLDALIIDPFQEKLKAEGEKTHTFDQLSIKVFSKPNKSTRWKEVLSAFTTYLTIRADDSRAKDMEGVGYYEGVGYCIRANDLHAQLNNLIKEYTTEGSSLQCAWPSQKKDAEHLRILHVPLRTINQYSHLTKENAKIVLNTRHFKKSLEEEVITAFKDLNKAWHQYETKYNDSDNIPKEAESPVTRLYEAGSHLIITKLVTVPTPDYKEIIHQTAIALLHPEQSTLRYTLDKQNPFINIKSLNDFLKKEIKNNTKIKARYDIFP